MRHNKNIIGVCDVPHWIEDKVSDPHRGVCLFNPTILWDTMKTRWRHCIYMRSVCDIPH